MRWRLIAAVLVLCACRPKPAPLWEAARSDFRRGESQAAREKAGRGLKAHPRADDVWHWRFRYLLCEILLPMGEKQEALSLLQEMPPAGELFASSRVQRNMLLGQANRMQSKFDQAQQHLNEARVTAKTLGDMDLIGSVRTQEGGLYLAMRKWDLAEAALDDALQIATERRDPYLQGGALINLGMGRLLRSRYDEAVPFLERALAAAEQADARTMYSAVLGNLALCYYRLGDFDKALRTRERAIAFLEKAGVKYYLQQNLGEMGATLLLTGEPRKAIPYLERAIALAREIDAPVDVSRMIGNLAAAYADLQQWDTAEKLNREAAQFRNERSRSFPQLNSAAIAAGRGDVTQAINIYEELIRTTDDPAIQWQAQAALAALQPEQAAQHFEAALDLIERTRADLLRIDYKLTFLTRLIQFYQRYVEALAALGQYEKALRVADSSRARVLSERARIEIPPAARDYDYRAAARRSNSVFLTYWLAPRKSYVWVVTPREIRCFPLPGEEALAPLIESYQAMIERGLRDPVAEKSELGERLSRILLAPVQPFIPPGTRVLLVSDGRLHGLNLETLPAPDGPPRYWIEDVTVTVAPSLYLASSASAEPRRRKGLLLVGDPEYNTTEFPKLKFAAQEMESVARHFPTPAPVRLTGAAATPAAYRDAHPERFSTIHFTAHASANRESPLDSAVLLSGDIGRSNLYARDILEQPLDANLVTISACRGAGARAYSGEGLVGFAWTFLRAGARHVIGGLWDVSDNSTALLMEELYTQLAAGAAPAEALRAAKRKLIHEPGKFQNFRKPFYWGAFQAYAAGLGRTRAIMDVGK
jgi:tetratricopeptide (TPR) repeat protein